MPVAVNTRDPNDPIMAIDTIIQRHADSHASSLALPSTSDQSRLSLDTILTGIRNLGCWPLSWYNEFHCMRPNAGDSLDTGLGKQGALSRDAIAWCSCIDRDVIVRGRRQRVHHHALGTILPALLELHACPGCPTRPICLCNASPRHSCVSRD